jgi:hypothetical protein
MRQPNGTAQINRLRLLPQLFAFGLSKDHSDATCMIRGERVVITCPKRAFT